MTHGYGEPGSPSPDGEPDEWDQFRAPRQARRDGYPPAGPPRGGPPYGEPAYGEPGYRDPAYGAPASGPAYGAPAPGPVYGTPASGPAYGAPASGPAYGAPASGPAYGAPASGPAYGGPPGGRDYRDPGYDNPADGRRRPAPHPGQGYPPPPGQPQPGYQQPGYPPPGGADPGYRGPARPGPGYSPSTYQASGYPAPPVAPGRPDQVYGRPDGGWQDPRDGYQQPDYRQADYRGPQGQGAYRGGAPGAYGPAGRRPGPGGAPMDDMLAPRNRTAPDAEEEAPPRKKLGRILYSLVTAAVVLALAGFGYTYFVRKNSTAPNIVVSSTPVVLPASDPILSQKTDPKALTTDEVFTKLIHSSATGGDYTVEKSQAVTGCADIATTKIQTLLTSLGCTQVVRANLLSPDGRYTITAGIVNMPDEKSASSVRTSIGSLVTGGKDHFNAYVATADASTAPQPTTHLGWDSRGHYVFYVVIGLASGDPINATDERTPLIISDIVETYLSTTVVGAREKIPTPATSK